MANTLARNFHYVVAVLAAVWLAYMVWFWHPTHPQPATAEAAAWHIFIVALAVMIYLAIQATATLAMPVGSERRILTDLLFSLLPLLVFAYALIDWGRGNLEMTIFQWMTLCLWGLAAGIDVVIFTWFSMRVMRRSPEISLHRDP
jgi:hypothetical protein